MPKCFKKPKKPIFRPFWGLFSQNWAKMNFLGKKDSGLSFWKKDSVFKYFNYLPSCKKSEKTNTSFLRNMLN